MGNKKGFKNLELGEKFIEMPKAGDSRFDLGGGYEILIKIVESEKGNAMQLNNGVIEHIAPETEVVRVY